MKIFYVNPLLFRVKGLFLCQHIHLTIYVDTMEDKSIFRVGTVVTVDNKTVAAIVVALVLVALVLGLGIRLVNK